MDREMESGSPGVPQVRCTSALAPSTRKRGGLWGSRYAGGEPWRPSAWGGGEWVAVLVRTGMVELARDARGGGRAGEGAGAWRWVLVLRREA